MAHQRKTSIQNPSIDIGKYRVSPLTRRLPDHRYAASVSIRSGSGIHTHDRVLRLIPLFDSSADAIRYAMDQAQAWLREQHSPTSPFTPHEERTWPRKN